MRRRTNRVLSLGAMCTTVALLTTSCLSSDSGSGGGGDAAADGGTADGDGVVEILGAFGGTEQESFEKEIKAFEDENGIDIQYTGTQDFQTILKSKVRGGDTPDIAVFPQPGTIIDLAGDGVLVPIEDYLDVGALQDTLIPGLLESSELDGTFYAAPMRMAVKSLVWVPKDAYKKGGYPAEPKSIQELQDVAEQIKSDGIAPWCLGMESEAATGWVGTDWIEEFVLRLHGPEVYDQWVAHEIPFDDPKIQEAFEAFRETALKPGYVRGGGKAIVNTSFSQAGLPAFDNPPKCMMERQGNFVTGFYPEDVKANLDDRVSVFYFPPYEGGYDGAPVLGGGDLAALMNPDDEEAIKVMEYLTSEDFGKSWAGDGGWLSPHSTFDASAYPDETTRQVGEIAANADVFRFDASDLMPKAVGGGSFWTGMAEWTTGDKTTEEVTKEIEASWPSS